jgi:hypothetical protein
MTKKAVFWCALFTLCLLGLSATPALAGATHRTNVTLNLSGSLIAAGRVRVADGTHSCETHRKVLIQKRGDGGGWQTLESQTSHPNGTYRFALPDVDGAYRAFVKKLQLGGSQGTCASAVSRVVVNQPPAPPPSNCTPGYAPCLVYHGGADYDCYGGSGNGPYYTAPGVTYRVTGYDPYGLDSDNDGYGCE